MAPKRKMSPKRKNKGNDKIVPKKYLTRNSPPLPANDYKNKIKDGNDGNSYASIADKNGIYRWKRFYQTGECKTAAKFYSQYPNALPYIYDIKSMKTSLTKIKRALLTHNIYLIRVGWDFIWDFGDYESDLYPRLAEIPKVKILLEKYWKDTKIKKRDRHNSHVTRVVSFLYYSEFAEHVASTRGEAWIMHSLLKKDKPIIYETFNKHFKNKFKWNKSDAKSILINLYKK
jgi:hypothetical protein